MRHVTLKNLFPGTVLVDSREQKFFTFRNIPVDGDSTGQATMSILTKTVGLASGDYSLYGYADKIAVERKSLADLFSTVTQGRDRFERELARLNQMEYAAIVVEAEWSDVVNSPPEYSGTMPKTVYRSVLAWSQRYVKCHWFFCPNREFAELTTFRILERYWKDANNGALKS